MRFTADRDAGHGRSAEIPSSDAGLDGIHVAVSVSMRATHQSPAGADNRWDRLQELLTDLRPGQVVTIRGVSDRTGLGPDAVHTVLQALTRAELFAQVDQTTFVRDSLMKF
jgi:hypothetical protein